MKLFIQTFLFLFAFSSNIFAQSIEVESIVNQGIALHDKGDYAGAINLYKKALGLDPKSETVNYEIASTYFAKGEFANALPHCDVVISLKSKNAEAAYILKGSALDELGKPNEAIESYKDGIRKNKDSYLLYFNIALTYYNIKDYISAEDNLQHSLKINPLHASSHFLLANTMKMKQDRLKTVLALYNFLLIEPNSKRSTNALKLLDKQLNQGVQKESETKINITLFENKDNSSEFQAAELMLSLLAASSNLEENKKKTASQLFVSNTESTFSILGELKKKNKGFWWNYYVDFFSELKDKKHTEAFCYFITQNKNEEEITKWIANNQSKVDDLLIWFKNYKR